MTTTPDALAAGIAETVRLNDALRAELTTLLADAMREARLILKHGNPTAKTRMVQSIISNAVRDASRQQDTEEDRRAQQQQMTELFSRVFDGLNVKSRVISTIEELP